MPELPFRPDLPQSQSYSRARPEARNPRRAIQRGPIRDKKRDVTGALLAYGDWFVQALEGEEGTVRGLYEKIFRDGRHEKSP